MCGILGYCTQEKNTSSEIEALKLGIEEIEYRGPDNTGHWFSKENLIGLAHKRLSILDLSSKANQPMENSEGTYIVVFNGEIYNFKEIRLELQNLGYEFFSSSDTEVILNGYIAWGVSLFKKLQGMFALSIIDLVKNELILGRDICGEKPLYYTNVDNAFYFGSEIKPLLHFSKVKKTISHQSLNYLFSYGHCLENESIYKDIHKLPAGTFLKFNFRSRDFFIKKFFNLEEKITQKNNNPHNFGEESFLLKKLQTLLEKSIDLQLHADVPVGLLLSGGIDSSLIAALASGMRNKLDTYTVKFSSHKAFDESDHASLISREFNTNHHELEASKINPEIFEEIVNYCDEPIFDSSIIPTFLLSKAISKDCKVAIGGDGGDELFGGYPHYDKLLRLKCKSSFVPHFFRKNISKFVQGTFPTGFKGKKTIELFSADFKNSYPDTSEFFSPKERNLIFNPLSVNILNTEEVREKNIITTKDFIDRATFFDFQNFLRNDLLVKIDRASMAHSLEIRSPFLDKELINFAFLEVPSKLKVTKKRRKILLKLLADKILPLSFDVERKRGFSIPVSEFLKEKKWHDYFSQKISESDANIFNKENIYKLLESSSKYSQNAERLFAVIFFMCWEKRYKPFWE